MAWIESHQEIGRHPKTKKLARRLGVSIPTAVGHLHLFWHWAMDFAESGGLDDFESWEIADAAMWEGDPDEFVDALITVGFVDRTDTGSALHDWDHYTGRLRESRDRYREANRERQRRYRERQRNAVKDGDEMESNVMGNVTVTSNNGPTVPNQTIQKETGADAPARSKNGPKPLPENGPAQQIVKAFCIAVGIDKPAAYGKTVGQAQLLADAGISPDDIPDAVAWCRSQKWLSDGFDLGSILSNADKWRAARRAPKPMKRLVV